LLVQRRGQLLVVPHMALFMLPFAARRWSTPRLNNPLAPQHRCSARAGG